MTKPFDYLVHKQWCQDFSFWWHWHFHWHEYLLLRNERSILSKWHAFAGYPPGFAVCTNCFEKCINYCANVNSVVRNAPKRLRKTVKWLNAKNWWGYARLRELGAMYWTNETAFTCLIRVTLRHWFHWSRRGSSHTVMLNSKFPDSMPITLWLIRKTDILTWLMA